MKNAYDFSPKTIRALAGKGITVIGTTYLPGPDGLFTDGERGYKLDDNGCGKVRTFREVLEMAK